MLDPQHKYVPSKVVENHSEPYWKKELSEHPVKIWEARKISEYRSKKKKKSSETQKQTLGESGKQLKHWKELSITPQLLATLGHSISSFIA